MQFKFSSELIEWRGPAPFVFAPIGPEDSESIRVLARELSYGWGVIPVRVRIGVTDFTTSIIPKLGQFLLPVKKSVQTSEGIGVGSCVLVEMTLGKS